MKLLIACDMEGISGVTTWEHVTPSHAEYVRFRKIMTDDVNAAVAGAAESGATDIQIADGHWNSGNVMVELLDARARINTGSPSPYSMVQGVDKGIDAAIFIGYHAMVGTPHAILDHTYSSAHVDNLWLNGRLTGEFGLNAAVCGHFGAPVLMVSGDQSVCAEAKTFVPEVEGVEVKQAAARMNALCLPPLEAQKLIKAGAKKVVADFVKGKKPQPLRLTTPISVTIEFFTTIMADSAELLPGSKRLDGRRVEFVAKDMPEAYRAFRTMVSLAPA